MRCLILVCATMAACAKPEPVQDPLDYLRVGVDPREEAEAIIEDLRLHGFTIGRQINERDYVDFDAIRGPESTFRVVTSRGPTLSIQVPDVRWPSRLWVELGPDPRPDFDRDGRRDIVVALRERERTCLAWAQVDPNGFVSEVFRPRSDWGDSPCVLEIDTNWPRILLEVSVPDSPVPNARVRFPVKATARTWVLDDSASASARWDREIENRQQALEEADARGDLPTSERLRTELGWLEQLRKAKEPVLEPASDGEEAR
ncbi:MAG: hypothetical protein JSU89_07335 [Myxococcales bacterium]|nr:MAG: hypothetical protein JSU89_07335 [Myxococcales bacterium]